MQRFVLLLGALLFLSITAAAQEDGITVAHTATAAPVPPQGGGSILPPWQLAITYQFNHLGTPLGGATTSGVDLSLVRFLTGHFGLEANSGAGFGNIGGSVGGCPLTCVKTVFVGGGGHLSLVRDHRLEPWVHGLVGLEHYRFSQTPTIGSLNAFAFVVGGGIDWNFNPRAAIRAQADYLGTRVIGAQKSNFQAVGGLVLNF